MRARYEPLALAAPVRGRLLPRAQPDDRRARPVAHDDHGPGLRGRGRRRGARGARRVRELGARGAELGRDRRSGPHGARHRRAGPRSRPCGRARPPSARASSPGFIVTHIAGRELKVTTDSARAMRPVEERFAIRRLALRRLLGVAGTRVTVRYLDNADHPGHAVLVRDEPTTKPVQHRPPAAALPRGARAPAGRRRHHLVQRLPARARARRHRARHRRLPRARRARARHRPARQPGRPRRHGDPHRGAPRRRAAHARQHPVPRLLADARRRAPRRA